MTVPSMPVEAPVGLGGGGICDHGWVERQSVGGDHQVYSLVWKCSLCGAEFIPAPAIP